MVLSHASDEGVQAAEGSESGGKGLVTNLKQMLSKPKAKAA